MAGGGFQTSGPTPWWQTTQGGTPSTGGTGSALTNLQNSAPPGYKYDPIQMQYVRTPTSVGADTGAQLTGLMNAAPPGIASMFNNPVASGTTGSGAFGTAGNPATGAFPKVNFGATIPGGSPGPSQGGGSGIPPGIPGGSPGPSQGGPTLTLPDQSASVAAKYGAAKDNVGQETSGALRGLAGAMAGRGIVGSGVEGRGQLGVVNQGQQQLGATDRASAEEQANLAADFAKTRYGGEISQRGQDITMRGQDIGAQEAQLGAGVTQRGQDIGYAESQGNLGLGYSDLELRRQQALLSALKGFNIGGGSTNLYGGPVGY